MYKKTLFWFRQDLRTHDNTGLIDAIKNCDSLLPIFVLDKNLIPEFLWLKDQKFLFLKEALLNLDKELKEKWGKLTVFYDKPEELIPKLCVEHGIHTIQSNKSYGSYGQERDRKIESWCVDNDVDFVQSPDFLLCEPEEIELRKTFSSYYRKWQIAIENKDISAKNCPSFTQIQIDSDAKSFLNELIEWDKHPKFTLEFARKKLRNFDFKNYDKHRNEPWKDWVSQMSPYHRHGIISIRYLYAQAKWKSESYISELAWRDFWNHIAYQLPYTRTKEFLEKRRYIKRSQSEKNFEAWCNWETGYPIVDAAMKQLVQENWMHGRTRMVVASFLTKDLLIDWRKWDAFFKKHLLDYDENVNNWNWQWSASVGADPKPIRIFNPNLQSKKFDKEAKYIKKYLPDLQYFEAKEIHAPQEHNLKYAKPIIDHSVAQKEAKEAYKESQKIFEEKSEST